MNTSIVTIALTVAISLSTSACVSQQQKLQNDTIKSIQAMIDWESHIKDSSLECWNEIQRTGKDLEICKKYFEELNSDKNRASHAVLIMLNDDNGVYANVEQLLGKKQADRLSDTENTATINKISGYLGKKIKKLERMIKRG